MAKRLKKFTVGELIKNWKSLPDTYLHFVLTDKKVRLVTILHFDEKIFTVKTTKGHILKLHLQDISEVWQELNVSSS